MDLLIGFGIILISSEFTPNLREGNLVKLARHESINILFRIILVFNPDLFVLRFTDYD